MCGVELVWNLTASNFCIGTLVIASTHEALEAEHCYVKILPHLTDFTPSHRGAVRLGKLGAFRNRFAKMSEVPSDSQSYVA